MKNFISLPDVFADIFNAVLFQGERILQPEELKNVQTEYTFVFTETSRYSKNKSKGKNRSKKKSIQYFRDVVKETSEGCTFSIILGTEAQQDIDNTMAQRIMLYDALEYERQIRLIKAQNEAKKINVPKTRRIRSDQKLLPVISVVIYTGMTPWTGPKCLYDMLSLPDKKQEKLLPYINDYSTHIIDMRHLSQKEIEMFSSDFRLLAETLNEILPKKPAVHHDELLDVLSLLRQDNRYLELKETIDNRKDDDQMSCGLLDAAIEKGRRTGLEEGRRTGLEEGRRIGLEEGWKIFILNNIEEQIPKQRTIEKLQIRFGLSKEEAEKEYEWASNLEEQP